MSTEIDRISKLLENVKEQVVALQSQLLRVSSEQDLQPIEREVNETLPHALSDLQQKLVALQASLKHDPSSPSSPSAVDAAGAAKAQAVAHILSEISAVSSFSKSLAASAALHSADCHALADAVAALCAHLAQHLPLLLADTPADALPAALERCLSKAVAAVLSSLALVHACALDDTLTFLASYWVHGVEESPFRQAHARLAEGVLDAASLPALKRPHALEDAYQAWLAKQLAALSASPVEFAREALLKRLDAAQSPSAATMKASLQKAQIQIANSSTSSSTNTSSSSSSSSSSTTTTTDGSNQSQEMAYIQIEPSELEIVRQIGTGAFATVHEALMAGERVAVKRINDQPGAFEQLCNEVQVMNKFHSAYIVPLYGGYLQGANAFLVMELVGRGALFDVLVHGKTSLPWPLRWSFARDVALSVYYLHSRDPPIVHRDLKSDNLLVTAGWRVKLTDFGLSLPTVPTPPCGGCGTPRWMAPELELFPDRPYDLPADVYSVGMILWEIGTRSIPWEYDLSNSIIAAVCAGKRPDIPKEVPRALAALIRQSWHQDPKARPTAREIARLIELEDVPDDLSAVMEEESLDAARAQLKGLEEQHRALQQKREEIERAIDSAQRQAKDAQRQRDELQRQSQEAKARADNFSKKSKALELDRERLVKQIANQREKLESEKKKAQKKLKQAEAVRQQEINEQEEQIAAARQNLEKLQRQRQELIAQKESSS